MQNASSLKVHIAGSPDGLIQRCTRCYAKLTDNMRHTWEPGDLVRSHRYGKSFVTEQQAVGIRPCGRAK